MVRSMILAFTFAAASCCVAANEASGTITILEGEALVYRGAARFYAVEGFRLAGGDIVETSASAFAQIEFSDRFVLQFGPGSRAMMQVASIRGRQERVVYVLQGWGKVSNTQTEAAGGVVFDLRTPLLEVPASPGVIVFQSTPAETTLFAERADVRVSERNVRGAPVAISIKAGQYYQRKTGLSGGVLPAAPKPFIEQIPRHFRDSLPLRTEKFRGREIKARDAPGFSYADVEPWLKAEPWIRRQFVQRWRVKSRDSAFRTALVANLSSHPEWDPVLFPEKYLPKDPPPPKTQPASTPAVPVTPTPARQ